jgi:hypothetical protein
MDIWEKVEKYLGKYELIKSNSPRFVAYVPYQDEKKVANYLKRKGINFRHSCGPSHAIFTIR